MPSLRIFCACGLLLAASLPSTAHAQIRIRAPFISLPAGSDPSDLALGDLNEDGVPDAVVTRVGVNQIGVMMGVADGGYAAPVPYACGSSTVAIAIGNLNGDGHLDVAAANSGSNSVTIWFGSGAGTLGGRIDRAVGFRPTSIALGDVDGDGALDIATGNANGSDVSILRNAGGAFTAAPSVAGTGDPRGVSLADLNEDGALDLVAAWIGTNKVTVHAGAGNGTFGAGTDYAADAGPGSVVVADLDLDGHLDVAVRARVPDRISIWPGGGDGTLGPRADIPVGPGSRLNVDHADADGIPDLLCPLDAQVALFRGIGALQYGPPAFFSAGLSPNCVRVVDANRDGWMDLLFSDGGAIALSYIPGNGAGGFGVNHESPTGPGPVALAVADFNGDTRLDVVTAGDGPSITFLPGNGLGGFGSPVGFPLPLSSVDAMATGDLDGDSHADLVITDDGADSVRVLLGAGDGTFLLGESLATGSLPWDVALADFNDDGRLDLAVAEYGAGAVGVYLANPGGGFGPRTPYPAQPQTISLAVGDLEGDGTIDIVAVNNPGSFTMLRGHGDGTFEPGIHTSGWATASGAALADVDGDGDLDLGFGGLVQGQPGLTAWVMRGDGAGGFGPGQGYGTLGGAIGVAFSDLDLDGSVDLIVPNASNVFTVLAGHTSGSFGDRQDLGTGNGPYGFAVADMNGDGRPDLVNSNLRSGTVSVLLNQSGLTTSVPPIAASVRPTGPRIERARFHGAQIEVLCTLAGGAPATLELLDLAGRRLQRSALGVRTAGRQYLGVAFDKGLVSGVYFIRLAEGGAFAARRLVRLR